VGRVKITVIFDVGFENKDPNMYDVNTQAFLNYLYDMLYIGCDREDDDPFWINNAELHLYEIRNVKSLLKKKLEE
jgi:hypothetical protein